MCFDVTAQSKMSELQPLHFGVVLKLPLKVNYTAGV